MHNSNPENWSRDSGADFLAFAQLVLPHSYSQRLQDLWAMWESGFSGSGYFVEFGALNGRDFSNTYLLEQLGWNGVVAEPHPDYHEVVRKNRKCVFSTKCVFSESGKTLTFHAVRGRPALSSLDGFGSDDSRSALREDFIAHEVETISLHDLLTGANAPKAIDFLSIDTEGSELVILESFDFSDWKINTLCVEHNDHQRDGLYALLTGHGFVRKWEHISGHDDWYVHTDTTKGWDTRSASSMMEKICAGPRFESALTERLALLNELTPSPG